MDARASAVDPKHIRVMVIDDQRTMRAIVRRLLVAGGVRDVSEAANAMVALEKLRSGEIKEPDVVVCDLHMDEMDGLEFCNAVRRDQTALKGSTPILVLTGDDDPLIHDVVAQVGAAKVLLKPISSVELLKEIETAIGFNLGIRALGFGQ